MPSSKVPQYLSANLNDLGYLLNMVMQKKGWLDINQQIMPYSVLIQQAELEFVNSDIFARLRQFVGNRLIELFHNHPLLGKGVAPIDSLTLIETGDLVVIDVDSNSYYGDIKDIKAIRQLINNPILARDIYISEYQLFMAFVYGADYINLNLDILNQEAIGALYNLASQLMLGVVFETSDPQIVSAALDICRDIDPMLLNKSIVLLNGTNWQTMDYVSFDDNVDNNIEKVNINLKQFREDSTSFVQAGVLIHQLVK